jgi:hypothetical protein
LLARSDIDAVMIGTSDHWYAKMLTDADGASKDEYCENILVDTPADWL